VISVIASEEPARVVQPWSRRLRGNLRFTNAANTFFQGLTADGAKMALWMVTREAYVGRLRGCYPVAFMHDEILAEGPSDSAHDWVQVLDEAMKQGMATVTPDVPVVTEPALMDRWYKGAKPVFSDDGELVPWEP